MTDETKPKRASPISWRPPADKRAEFDAMLAQSGLTANALITECVFGRSRIRVAEQRMLAQILAAEAQQSDLLRTIAQAGSDADLGTTLQIVREGQIEIRSALFVLMERKP